MEQRTYAPAGELVQRKFLRFKSEAFTNRQRKPLPPDIYPNSLALSLVFPILQQQTGGSTRFYIIGFDGILNQLEMWPVGVESRPIQQVTLQTRHNRLKPIIELPTFLKPIAYFLIPTFDLYLADDQSRRLLQFEGPLGPPGAPTARFTADPQLRTPLVKQASASPTTPSR